MAVRHAVEIVTVGDELLLGETLDTNAAFVARACAAAGFEVRRETTLPDDPEPLRRGLAEARERGGFVIVTGGLGPTPDDLTRWALAAVFGRGLTLDRGLLAELEAKFRRFGYATMPATNRVQAELPTGATALPNTRGTAPGILIEDERATVFALPGVPFEMEGMLLEDVLPAMRRRAGAGLAPLHQRTIRTAAIGESALAERIADLVRETPGVRVAYLPSRGSVDVRLTALGLDEPEAHRALAELQERLAHRLAPWTYGLDEETLAGSVGRALRASGRTLAVAESCTGGLVGDLITDEPGSSDYFVGGVVAYADEVKGGLLGVSPETLRRHGAVSAETCAELLAGARRLTGADCALAVTGIAGPGGGTPEKPVGLVHLGVDVAGTVRLERREGPGPRRAIKLRAAKAALLLLLRTLEEPGAADMKVRAREHFFKSGDAPLFFRAWEAPAARGTVLVVHGLGEHSGRHARLASHLRKTGFATVVYDLRGHGRSGGPRGHLERFAQHVEDLAVFRRVVEDQGRPGPRFLLGHSLGGLIAVHYWLAERPPDLAGLVLSSPALAPRFRVSAARRSLARLLVRLPPAVRLSHGIRPEDLSHDPAVAAECARDRLYQTRSTPRALLAILDAMDEARARAPELTAPLLALGGEDDRVASPMTLRDFVRQAGSADKRAIVYARFYHEVFNEAERERPLADLAEWLDERCP